MEYASHVLDFGYRRRCSQECVIASPTLRYKLSGSRPHIGETLFLKDKAGETTVFYTGQTG